MQRVFDNILRDPALWYGGQVAPAAYRGISSGFPALDRALPEAGWPMGALVELLVDRTGAGELSLLMPALRTVCAEGRRVALVAPPHLPHARAWDAAGIPLDRLLVVEAEGAELLWSAEQILQSGECGALLAWMPAAGRVLDYRALQRLHLAAGKGDALCIAYRGTHAQAAPSPAPLRLRLETADGALRIHIAKCRGAARARPIPVYPFPAHWIASDVTTPSVFPATASPPARMRVSAG
ncbi:translesion DNA synthesis-associated protein ImuA [Nitrosovibrio sp. Nv17]|uniref:translesion DNA synthesis-associated protein ImuA n=1 Tax=Nitrosovibrio sp. Nv17 TaxID=1855339 RepID=UPI00090869BF|nr:translesion DNA synthesis-associated protein ImuA [Nitrosovibrio sp. Nv17]SFW34925.1 protein ImuA [Nitrosovibrio sp. Nv17]